MRRDSRARLRTALLLSACAVPCSAWGSAQEHDHAAMHAQHHGSPASSALESGGNAMFEAMAEVVQVLEADAATDWSKVDLDALRRHLLDMNALFEEAAAAAEEVPGGARFTVTGSEEALAAARRMVPAHAPMLEMEGGWEASASVENGAVVLVVTGGDEGAAARIRGLGFFGLMASGDHHRAHHLAIARGRSHP